MNNSLIFNFNFFLMKMTYISKISFVLSSILKLKINIEFEYYYDVLKISKKNIVIILISVNF